MLTIKILPNDKGNPPGKLADVELHFTGATDRTNASSENLRAAADMMNVFDGLKLIGFGLWQQRDGRRTVTFPARAYSVNGERRSFALLRPIVDLDATERIKARILEAYAEYEATQQTTAV